MTNACNEMLMPVVNCPWGCTEYMHKSGHAPFFDGFLQRYLPKVCVPCISGSKCDFGLWKSALYDYVGGSRQSISLRVCSRSRDPKNDR